MWGFIWGLLFFLNWAGNIQLGPVYLLIFDGGRCRRWDFRCLLTLWSPSTQREMTEMLGTVCMRGKAYRSRGVIKGTDEAVGGRQLAWLCVTHCWLDKQLYNAICRCAKPRKWEFWCWDYERGIYHRLGHTNTSSVTCVLAMQTYAQTAHETCLSLLHAISVHDTGQTSALNMRKARGTPNPGLVTFAGEEG